MTDAQGRGRGKSDGVGPARRWSFDAAVLDEAALKLFINGQAVELERKPLEVLLHLLRHAGQVVTKDALLAAVWPGRIISDSALTSCIAKLREALGDESQAVIKTVHGYGYRLEAAVRSEPCATVASAQPVQVDDPPALPKPGAPPRPDLPRSRTLRHPTAMAGVAALMAAMVLGGLWHLSRPILAGPPSVAVLPFANLSEDKQNEYFADGIHDSIISHLARVKGMKVISRTSVMEYKGKTLSLKAIGKALGVKTVVEGTVQRTGNQVRISAQLIDTGSDQHLWAEMYDRDIADIFSIQSEVAEKVVAAVNATLTRDEKKRIKQRPTRNAEAYDLYLRAAELLRQHGAATREPGLHIQSLLERAIALDPGFALAHAALGRSHITMYWFGIDTTQRRRNLARESIETALRLQPDLAEGHFAQGLYFYHGLRDYNRALQEFDQALLQAPGLAEAHAWIGYVQRRLGQWSAAVASLTRAAELDPRSTLTLNHLAFTHISMRQYETAAALLETGKSLAPDNFEATLWPAFLRIFWKGELEPIRAVLAENQPGSNAGELGLIWTIRLALADARYADAIALLTELQREELALGPSGFAVPKAFHIGQAYAAMGDVPSARTHIQIARDRLQTYISHEPDSVHVADAHAWLGLAHAYLGDRAAALRSASRATELLPVSRDAVDGPHIDGIVAAVHMRLGDHKRALSDLARLLTIPGGLHAHSVRLDLEWKPLWNDARFQDLILQNLPTSAR